MSSLRRLAKDHASLRAALPPNYLFVSNSDFECLPDDLTQLSIHLTGSEGTPYSSGLWLLHLRIPHDYPKSPPKATFKTRIFHPNVEEATGAVCLEALKRDWDPKLTLKDILVTISCLLIQPNPDSALNEKAGVLVREDYDGFVRQAKLMTRIHAPIPPKLKEAVDDARRRGEDRDSIDPSSGSRHGITPIGQQPLGDNRTKLASTEVYSSDEAVDAAKENSLIARQLKRKDNVSDLHRNVLGKRPLTEVATTSGDENALDLQPTGVFTQTENGERPRKSPKHTHSLELEGEAIVPLTSLQSGDFVSDSVLLDRPNPPVIVAPALQSAHSKSMAPTKYRSFARVGIKRL